VKLSFKMGWLEEVVFGTSAQAKGARKRHAGAT
jgi:hypothetical protein